MRNKILNLLISLFPIIQTISYYAIATSNTYIDQLTSHFFMIAGLLTFALALTSANRKYIPVSLIILLLYIGALLALKADYNTVVKTLGFVIMLGCFCIAGVCQISERTYNIIKYSLIAQGLLLSYLYFTPLAYKAFVDIDYVHESNLLTLGFPNPNETGIILYTTIAGIFLFFEAWSHYSFALKYLLLGFLSYLLYLTGARGSMLSLGVFLLLFYYMRKKGNKATWRAPNWFSIILTQIPLVFVVIYSYMALNPAYANVTLLGKRLISGRERVYEEVLTMFNDPIFGDLNIFQFQNSHNSALTIIVNIGLLGYFIYSCFMAKNIITLGENGWRNPGYIMLLSFFLNGAVEAAMFTGGHFYFVIFLTACIIANNPNRYL